MPDFWPILTILPDGGMLLPEECDTMFFRGFMWVDYNLMVQL